MTQLRGEALYWAAFERLKAGKTEIIDTSLSAFKFTKDNVAIEAGKSKGFVKQNRYPELCKAIEEEEKERSKFNSSVFQKSKTIKDVQSQKNKANARYKKLKVEHDLCLEKMMNLLRENFELRREVLDLKSGIDSEHIKNNVIALKKQ